MAHATTTTTAAGDGGDLRQVALRSWTKMVLWFAPASWTGDRPTATRHSASCPQGRPKASPVHDGRFDPQAR
jgi:hypothetical protein